MTAAMQCASGHRTATSCTLLSRCRRRNRNTLLLLLEYDQKRSTEPNAVDDGLVNTINCYDLQY